jgi:hypothetical protein
MKRKETAICNVGCRYFDDNLLSHCRQNKRFNLWSTASIVNIARLATSSILRPPTLANLFVASWDVDSRVVLLTMSLLDVVDAQW